MEIAVLVGLELVVVDAGLSVVLMATFVVTQHLFVLMKLVASVVLSLGPILRLGAATIIQHISLLLSPQPSMFDFSHFHNQASIYLHIVYA
jgi:predicted phage tail protein